MSALLVQFPRGTEGQLSGHQNGNLESITSRRLRVTLYSTILYQGAFSAVTVAWRPRLRSLRSRETTESHCELFSHALMVVLQVMVKSAGCPRRGFAESTQIFGIVMMEKRTIPSTGNNFSQYQQHQQYSWQHSSSSSSGVDIILWQ